MESDELYLLAGESDASVKVRDALMDVKHLLEDDDDGLEQWVPVMKGAFPVDAADVSAALAWLRVAAPPLDRPAYTLEELVDEVVRPNDELLAVDVHKRRARYIVGGCMAEMSDLRTGKGSTRTIAVDPEDSARVLAAVRALGLASRPNVCMARGLKTLVGFGTKRYAVIDVGTNSVKLHVGERHADGTWSAVADRATVTRLGEGLDAAGSLEPEPMRRTMEAIAAMADESRRAGAVAIAAVGTAGMRAAANSAEFVQGRPKPAAASGSRSSTARRRGASPTSPPPSPGLGLARGSLVVFDTGGGSSPVHVRPWRRGRRSVQRAGRCGAPDPERYGLDRAISDDALAAALDGIAAELDFLDARPSPEALVGMGGALTNLAAVEHGLVAYDPDIVQGTRLDQAEIDRQIELYRTRTAEERRALVGLQPNRAEVILAGACVVRTVLTKLGCDSLRRERPRPAPRPDRTTDSASAGLSAEQRSAPHDGGGALRVPRPAIRCDLRLEGAVDVSVDAVFAQALQHTVLPEHARHGGLHAGEAQLDTGALGEVEDLGQLRRALGVDEVDALQVKHDGGQGRVGVQRELTDALLERFGGGEEQTTVQSHDRVTGERLVVGILAQVAEHLRSRLATEERHPRGGGDVDEPDEREPDADDHAGQHAGREHGDDRHGRHPEVEALDAVEAPQLGNVDHPEDHGVDDDRGEHRLRQL